MDENIFFIKINEDIDREINGFVIDPDIPLPAEKLAGKDNFDPADLSWEMIISGMLKILAYERDFEYADYYRKFVAAVKPDLFREMTQVAIYKAGNKNFDIAEEMFLALEGLKPENIPNLLNLAKLFEARAKSAAESGDKEGEEKYNDKACGIYKKALDMEPSNADIHFYAGAFFLNQNDYIKAREHLSEFISFSSDEDKKEAAAEIIQRLDSHDLADTLFKEAFDLIKADRLDEGIAKTKKFIEAHGNIWNGWFILGWAYRKAGEYKKGKEAFLKAENLGCASVDLCIELGVCLSETGDFQEAERYLKKAMDKEPDNVKVIVNFGILSMKKGDRDEAERFFKTALEFDPGNCYAAEYLKILGG